MSNLLTYPHRTFRCIKFCNDPKLLDKFRESAKLLDMVQKGLSDYLETKRAGFSRFYFLSNDELLEILSQTKVGNDCLCTHTLRVNHDFPDCSRFLGTGCVLAINTFFVMV